jgi:hypothetical protein
MIAGSNSFPEPMKLVGVHFRTADFQNQVFHIAVQSCLQLIPIMVLKAIFVTMDISPTFKSGANLRQPVSEPDSEHGVFVVIDHFAALWQGEEFALDARTDVISELLIELTRLGAMNILTINGEFPQGRITISNAQMLSNRSDTGEIWMR